VGEAVPTGDEAWTGTSTNLPGLIVIAHTSTPGLVLLGEVLMGV
jgi:hypothetical protein